MSTLTRPGLEHVATLLAGALSQGRRRRARLDSGPARAFQTDLRTITVPLPGAGSLRELTCGLALHASPTKEAVARAAWTQLSRRQQRALCWEEGEAAARWARGAWPGLATTLDDLLGAPAAAPDLDALLAAAALPERAAAGAGERPSSGARTPDDARSALAEALVRRALERGDDGDPPLLFGRLPPPLPGVEAGTGRRTFIATRWSSRHKAKREGALPIPVSGPGTEPVLDPGDPGTMEALDGRAGHAIGIPYDEWDGTLGRYRRGHVRVLELDEPPPAAEALPRLPVPDMRPARGIVRGLDSGDIDIDAVVRWRVDLAVDQRTRSADPVAPPPLYTALAPRHEPLAWALLVDASASSSLRGGNVLRRSAEFADALARTLAERGEHVGVFAFRSHGRERVEVRVLKHFDAPYAPLGVDVAPGGYTRLGAALRHTGTRLLATPARAHVLLSLGDALPYDEGYGERYGTLDVAKAVEELRGRGARVMHAALATREDESLDAMFAPDQWRHVRRVTDLLPLVEDVETEVRRGG